MDKTIMVYSGRNFTSEEIELIQWTRKKYSQLSRRELAATVCEFLGWTTPAGRSKIPQCSAFLKTLEEAGLIELPPIEVTRKRSTPKSTLTVTEIQIDTTPITCKLKAIEPIHLEIERAGADLKRWRHYLSFAPIICNITGRHKGTVLLCLQLNLSNNVEWQTGYPAYLPQA